MTSLPEGDRAMDDGGVFHADITMLVTSYVQVEGDTETRRPGPSRMLPWASLTGPADVVAAGLENAAALIRSYNRTTRGDYR